MLAQKASSSDTVKLINQTSHAIKKNVSVTDIGKDLFIVSLQEFKVICADTLGVMIALSAVETGKTSDERLAIFWTLIATFMLSILTYFLRESAMENKEKRRALVARIVSVVTKSFAIIFAAMFGQLVGSVIPLTAWVVVLFSLVVLGTEVITVFTSYGHTPDMRRHKFLSKLIKKTISTKEDLY